MEYERASLLNSQYFSASRSGGPRYRIQADNIEFLPTTRDLSVEMFYVRDSPRLSDDTDTVDGFNGYEVAAIYGACATVLQKEESDPTFYLTQKDRILKRIDALAAHRDGSHPERAVDVTGDLDLVEIGWMV